MFELLKNAVASVIEALRNNSDHRPSLTTAITAAHDCIVHLEERVAALEKAADAGLAVAQTVGAVVDAATGAAPAPQPAA